MEVGLVVSVIVAVIGSLAVIAVVTNRRDDAARAKATLERETVLGVGLLWLLDKHGTALRQQIRQKLYADAYGQLRFDKVQPVLNHFLSDVVCATQQPASEQEHRLLFDVFMNWIEDLDFEALHREPWDEETTDSDGLAYERLVGSLLTRAGFDVSFTPASGDQGVDLLAERAGERVAIQCKNYASAAGNDAVQQVYAGAKFYGAKLALVVAPNGYTIAARQLAASLGVGCLHHDEVVATLAQGLGFGPAARPEAS